MSTLEFISHFNYDRNEIVSGVTHSSRVVVNPNYGAKISFKSNNSDWRGSSYYDFITPLGINNLMAEMNFEYTLDKDNTKQLLQKLSDVSSNELTGQVAFEGHNDVINFDATGTNDVFFELDSDYYRKISGSQISSFNVSPISDDLYTVKVNLYNNRVSPFLNNGTGFVANKLVANTSTSKKKFDVFTGAMSDNNGANSNVFDNYFYVTEDNSTNHSTLNSSLKGLSTYTGIVSSATRTFFFEPDRQTTLNFDYKNKNNELKGAFRQSLNISKTNNNTLQSIDLQFSNRGQKETYAILHFLESHLGYKKFIYKYTDDFIRQNRVFYCDKWSHTFNYKNSNTINATFTEIASPVTPNF
jgi:phage-related protein